MSHPLVSVIIPNYNYGRFLAQTIDSVLAQNYPNIEIIVVDDGSSDESVEVLESYGDKIKWFKQQNSGVSVARNRGIKESRGEFIALLDSDDVWLPEKIEKQIKLFLEDPEIGLVHCGFVDFDNEGNRHAEHLDGMKGRVAEDMLRYQRSVILGGGSAVVFKKKMFDEIGGFSLNISPAEDWEFYYQAARRCKVGFVAEVLMEYRIHGNNNHLNISRMERAIIGAFDKVFSEYPEELAPIRKECYGRIHTVLAGSYFRAGQYGSFLRHAAKSLSIAPKNSLRYLGFPFRVWQRRHRMSSVKSSNG